MSNRFALLAWCGMVLLAAPLRADLVLTPETPTKVVIAVPDSAGDHLADFDYVLSDPNMSSVKSSHPAERLPYYAFLLSRRIEQVMGRKVPVVKESAVENADLVFNIGPTAACKAGVPDWDKLPPHCFSVTTDGKSNVFFAARDDFAVGFGVVEFMDKVMNCRQYMPAPLGECITRTDRLAIPADLRLRNTTVVASDFMSGVKAYGELFKDTNRQMEVALQLFKSDEFHHNLYNVIPVAKFGKDHPEYFPLINGKRIVPDGKTVRVDAAWQPCFSNPGVFQETVNYCIKWFDDHPGATSASIGVTDGDGWCQCEECRKMGSQWPGLWYRNLAYDFGNRVAREVARLRPGKMVGFKAYGMAQQAPEFKLEKNLLVYKSQPDDPPGTSLKAWSDLGASTGAYTWLYGYNMVTPRYFPHLFAQIYKRWHAEGAQGFYAETYPNWIVDAPMVYAVAKITRNPDADPDAILAQYADDMFGKEAESSIVAFYHVVEVAMARRADQKPAHDDLSELTSFGRPIRYQFDCWRVGDVKKMDAALAEAAGHVAPGSPAARRMELLQTWWSWSREYILAYALSDEVCRAKIASAADIEALLPTMEQIGKHVAGVGEEWQKHMGDVATGTPEAITERGKYLRGEPDMKLWWNQPGQWVDPRVWPSAKVEEALSQASQVLVDSMGKDQAVEFWTKLAKDHPDLAVYLEGQANLVKGDLPNLATNGSFEELDPASASQKWTWPAGFVLHNSGTRVTEDIGVDDKVARTGTHSWRSGKGTGGALAQTISVTPGGTYLVSVWIRQASSQNPPSYMMTAFMNVNVAGKDGKNIEAAQNPMERGMELNVWHQVRTFITIPPEGEKMTINFLCKGHEAGDFTWFDDLSVVKVH